MPVLHLIAGPNGAGKTTLYRSMIGPRHPALPFIDAQDHEARDLKHMTDPGERFRASLAWADARHDALLRMGHPFVTETVLSHPSRLALIPQARAQGFEVALYVLCLDEPRRLLQRVVQRQREGGHGVSSHEVLDRYPRCLANLRRAVRMADLVVLLDACEASEGGPRLIATIAAGQMQLHTLERPRWVNTVLTFNPG